MTRIYDLRDEMPVKDTGLFYSDKMCFVGYEIVDDNPSENEFGKLHAIFVFSEKNDRDQALYLVMRFKIETKDEYDHFSRSTANFKNMSEEMIGHKNNIMSGSNYGVNMFYATPIFEYKKAPNGRSYNTFQVQYPSTVANLYLTKTVYALRSHWLNLCHFINSIVSGLAVMDYLYAPDLDNSKVYDVCGLIYDGCSSLVDNQVYAHFVLYYTDGLGTYPYRFRVILGIDKDTHILMKQLPYDTFVKYHYIEDPLLLPHNSFLDCSKDPSHIAIMYNKDDKTSNIFRIPLDVGNRIKWGLWYSYITNNNEKEINNNENASS